MENRVKRLERAVLILSLMVSVLIGLSVYGVRKVVEIKESIPDYENVEKYANKAGSLIDYFKKEEK